MAYQLMISAVPWATLYGLNNAPLNTHAVNPLDITNMECKYNPTLKSTGTRVTYIQYMYPGFLGIMYLLISEFCVKVTFTYVIVNY